jgi:predicted nucleic acid-binding protein
MLKRALCDNAMAENQISEWFSQFKHNDTSFEDCVQFYHAFRDHTEQNVEKVRKIISKLMKQHSRGY